jgi:hypothetical protein
MDLLDSHSVQNAGDYCWLQGGQVHSEPSMDDSTRAPSIGACLCCRILLERHALRLPSDVHVIWVHGIAWTGHPFGIQGHGKHIDTFCGMFAASIVVKLFRLDSIFFGPSSTVHFSSTTDVRAPWVHGVAWTGHLLGARAKVNIESFCSGIVCDTVLSPCFPSFV